MKNIKNSFLVKFVVTLFLIGILIGVLFLFSYKPDLGSSLSDFKNLIETTRQNTFLSGIITISAVFILSVSIIGSPLIVFYLFYEGLSIGFALGAFLLNYKIKGLFFYLLFFIFSKLIYIALMIYFGVVAIRFAIKIVDSIASKNREELYKTVVYHFYRFIIVIVSSILNSMLIYLFANKILCLFTKLL